MECNEGQLNIFYRALKKVEAKYLRYPKFSVSFFKKGARKKYIEHLERVFAYELYRQWGNMIKPKSDYVLNAEIDKDKGRCFTGLKNEIEDEEISKYLCKSNSTIYPDLVLHKGQYTPTGHEIVCEIKRFCSVNKTNFKNDILKLVLFTHKQFLEGCPYQYGIFLLLNASIDKVIGLVKTNISTLNNWRNNKNVRLEHLYIVTCEPVSDSSKKIKVEHRNLADLLNEINDENSKRESSFGNFSVIH